jgi:hypothetical protein
MTAHGSIDWTAVEADFRAGILSNRQIGKKHGVSESAIRKEAKKGDWVRTKQRPAHQRQVVVQAKPQPSSARPVSGAVIDPKDHVALGKDLALRLLGELDATTTHIGEIEEMIAEATAGDANNRRYVAMMKAVGLPSRSMTLKTIAQALGTLNEAAVVAGKKATALEAAKEASTSGRFATPPAPKLAVDNTKR